MQKAMVFISLFLVCVLLCSCASTQLSQDEELQGTQPTTTDTGVSSIPNASTDDDFDDEETPNIPMLSKELSFVSPFMHRKAFIKVSGVENKTFYIDNTGAVLFEIDANLFDTAGNSYLPTANTYQSGLILISDMYGMHWTAACNQEGAYIEAASLGMTEFSDLAADDGYLIVYGENKVGILDSEFEWVVEPSNTFAKNFPYGIRGTTYYKDYIIYSKVGNARIDVRSGAVESYRLTDATIFYDNIPENWIVESDGYFFYMNIYQVSKQKTLGVEDIQTTMSCKLNFKGARFVDGKAPVVLYDNGTNYISLIDRNGSLLMEPVEVEGYIDYISISNRYIYVGCENYTLSTYDLEGNLVATKGLRDFEHYSTNFTINNDVITFIFYSSDSNGEVVRKYYCYSPDFRPLIG